MIPVTVITIGNELLYGQTLDTNAHFMSARLSDSGFNVTARISVGDMEESIKWALELAEGISGIILISGGLGPTRDDITKKALSDYFNSELKLNETALHDVRIFFLKRGLNLTEINRRQALVPACSSIIRNQMGTAPGIWIERNGKVFVSMPGVPHEMEYMLDNGVVPRLREKFRPPVMLHKSVMTAGIGESWLSEKIRVWEDSLPEHMKIAYLPDYGQVKLRLTATGKDPEILEAEMSEKTEILKQYIGQYIFALENIGLEEEIGRLLRQTGQRIALAESCTGGHIAHTLTSVQGSSDYFWGGIVAYHNSVKQGMLGVQTGTLENHGAVSEETVREMAVNVRQRFKTDMGLATTGIAGPGGGTEEKPVGLVWVGISDKNGVTTKKFNFSKDRVTNIRYTTVYALTMLWERLKQNTGIQI